MNTQYKIYYWDFNPLEAVDCDDNLHAVIVYTDVFMHVIGLGVVGESLTFTSNEETFLQNFLDILLFPFALQTSICFDSVHFGTILA